MKRIEILLTAVMLLVVALPVDVVARNHTKCRNEVLSNSRGFYKEIFMDPVILTALGVGGATVIGSAIGFIFRKASHKFSDIVLSFAAGAMILVAVHELIPQCQQDRRAQPYASTMGIVLGFATMMLLDVMLG